MPNKIGHNLHDSLEVTGPSRMQLPEKERKVRSPSSR